MLNVGTPEGDSVALETVGASLATTVGTVEGDDERVGPDESADEGWDEGDFETEGAVLGGGIGAPDGSGLTDGTGDTEGKAEGIVDTVGLPDGTDVVGTIDVTWDGNEVGNDDDAS